MARVGAPTTVRPPAAVRRAVRHPARDAALIACVAFALRFGGLGESFTDEDLDTLEPAAQVAEEIVSELTPKQLTPR